MEQFDQLLTCAICLDRYRNPKLLPCQHSFCMEPCMEGLVDYVKRQVKCPECRAEHRIPYQGVQAFPTNVTLQRFLELHIDLTGELPDPTANQIMERCQVCSEKSYLILCAHCDKKVCTDCKDAHMDVLKREISRISHQVRRALHRLEDALTLSDKNSLLLQQNSLSVMEEIDDIYKRLAKALKDRSEYMKHEVERYLQTELKTLNVFKYNMEQEVGNISSNCELVEKYISPDAAPTTTWDDSELMDTKDIFLKTMEFIRAFDYEPGDYARRVRFLMATDPNTLQVTLATYGDLHLPPSNPIGQLNGSNSTQPNPYASSQSQYGGTGLMRSKSDHRLTTQYRGQDYEEAPAGGGRGSPVFGRKFGERKEKAGGGSDLETFELPPTERKRFRSRFARHLPDNTFNDEADSRGVRFDSTNTEGTRRERERVLDTEDVARGPISGLVRLLDSPRVIQRVQETELGPRPIKVVAPAPTPVEAKAPLPWRAPERPSRQLSEDDEIAKQKRANKETVAAATSPKVAPPVVVPETRSVPRRQTSTEPKPLVANERTSSRTPSESGEGHDRGVDLDTTSHSGSDRIPRKLSPERYPAKNRSESSDSGTSETSSASSNASRNTGAAFTMDEIRQRFLSKSAPSSSADKPTSSSSPPINSTSGGATTGTTGRDAGATTGPTSTRPTTTTGATSSKPTFTTRYLGRTNTPTAEAKEDESSSEESESSESEDEAKVNNNGIEKSGSTAAPARMERTDIGPLLARSANERGNTSTNYSNSKKESPPTTVSSYRRNRDSAARLTSPPDRETSRFTAPTPPSNPSSNTNYGRYNSRTNSSDYGTGTGSALSRSRSTVYNTSTDDPVTSTTTPSSRYSGLASKYLNRSRHTFDDDTPLTTTTTTSSPSSRYGSSYSRPSYLSKQTPSTSSTTKSSSSKDKKASSKMSKSKSTHDVLAGIRAASLDFHPDLESDEVLLSSGSGRQGSGRRRRKLSVAPPDQTETENLSSWARYLKNKYGKGEKRTSLDRGMSLDETSTGSGAGSSGVMSDRPKRLSFSTPGHPYANKNRIQYKFGSRGSEAGKLTWPRGICCAEGPDGSVQVVVADSTNHRICVFDESGNFLTEFGSYGSGDGEFDCPGAVWVNRIGQFIVSDRYNHRIQVFDPSGRFLRAFGSQGEAPGKFSYPLGVTADALNFIYVCEEARIQVFQSDGTFVGKFGCPGSKIGELSHPHYIAVTSTNKVVVSDTNNSRIQIFDVNGKVLTCFGSEGSEEGLLKSPRGVAVDESGYIVVGDSGNNRIQIFSPDGIFVKSIGSWGIADQEFKGLEGLACANGNIFAVDRVNHSVTVI